MDALYLTLLLALAALLAGFVAGCERLRQRDTTPGERGGPL